MRQGATEAGLPSPVPSSSMMIHLSAGVHPQGVPWREAATALAPHCTLTLALSPGEPSAAPQARSPPGIGVMIPRPPRGSLEMQCLVQPLVQGRGTASMTLG